MYLKCIDIFAEMNNYFLYFSLKYLLTKRICGWVFSKINIKYVYAIANSFSRIQEHIWVMTDL